MTCALSPLPMSAGGETAPPEEVPAEVAAEVATGAVVAAGVGVLEPLLHAPSMSAAASRPAIKNSERLG